MENMARDLGVVSTVSKDVTASSIDTLYWRYTFKGEEHAVTPNKKRRTQPSTLQSIVAKLKEGKNAWDVYGETRSEASGVP